MYEEIYTQAKQACNELCDAAKLKEGSIVVIGCSSSEVAGGTIGHNSSLETAQAVFKGIYEVLCERKIYLAAQCCEHLNRAIIVEREAVPNAEIVNVVPQPKAGGSFATTAYRTFKDPVALEEIKADAGLDIGGTLIGMHLKRVAVPYMMTGFNLIQLFTSVSFTAAACFLCCFFKISTYYRPFHKFATYNIKEKFAFFTNCGII